MSKVGEHVTLDIIGTSKEYEPKFFEKLVYKIAKKAKVTVLEISKYKFEPQGFTLVALLAESHISFHTFPEKGIISFDFFTCGKVSPTVALDILKKEIKHKRIVKKEFNRDTVSYYDDIYSSPGLKKFYIVKNVLEDFTSKVGQHIEILDLEQFGKSLFIDNELQVAESDEHLYSSTFVNSGIKLNPAKDKLQPPLFIMGLGNSYFLESPFFAYSSILGPPGNSIPSNFAVLSNASPTASSMVVPNLLYFPKPLTIRNCE